MKKSVLWSMALAAGICVANLYYCQPLLQQIQQSLGGSDTEIGWIPTLTQISYALGMLLLVPMGDRSERKFLIVLFTVLSGFSMMAFGFSQSLTAAYIFSFFIGISTMTPHLTIPFAANLAPVETRGKVVGIVMSGLLLGILLSRTVAGFVGDAFGWRVMFISAGVALVILGAALKITLPRSEPTYQGSYWGLLQSVCHLVKTLPQLRESMLFGAVLNASFCAFWATLIHLVSHEPFNLGVKTVGVFGLIGAVSVLAAPIVGSKSDRSNPRNSVGFGILLTLLSFFIFLIWGSTSLIALGIGVFVMDLGVQAAHVANQTRIYSLLPEARSRLNTAYMFAYFSGAAMGSWLASYAWSKYQWQGVCTLSIAFLLLGLCVYLFGIVFPSKARTH